jgi:hypothetical protein
MITYDVLELKKSSTISRTFLFLYCFFYSWTILDRGEILQLL